MNKILNASGIGCSGNCTCVWDSYLTAWDCTPDDPTACGAGCGCDTPAAYTGGATTVSTTCYDPTAPTATPASTTPPATPLPTTPPATPAPTTPPATPVPTTPPATPAPTTPPATPAPTTPPATPAPTTPPATPAPTTPPATPSPTTPPSTSPPLPTMQPCSYCGYKKDFVMMGNKLTQKFVLAYDGCVNCDTKCLQEIPLGFDLTSQIIACPNKNFKTNGCDGCNYKFNPNTMSFELLDNVMDENTNPLAPAPVASCQNCGGCELPSPNEYFVNGKTFIHAECGEIAPSPQPFFCGDCMWEYKPPTNQNDRGSFILQYSNCSVSKDIFQPLCNPYCDGCIPPLEWYAGAEEYLYSITTDPAFWQATPKVTTGCRKIANSDVSGYAKIFPKSVPDSGQCECWAEQVDGEWKYVCNQTADYSCKQGCKCSPEILWELYALEGKEPGFLPDGNTSLPCAMRGDNNDKIVIPCDCGNTTQLQEGITSKTGEGKWMGLVGPRTETGGSYQNDQIQTHVNEEGKLVVRKFQLGENANMAPKEFGDSFGFLKNTLTEEDQAPM